MIHAIVISDADGEPVPVTVKFTVTEAEPACWRDADGDGHPGFPATAELVSVLPPLPWVQDYVETNWDDIEQEILDGLA